MNNWLKVFCMFLVCLAAYIGFDVLKLYGEVMTVIFAVIGIVLVLLVDKLNWSLLARIFHPEREIYSVDEWREKAVAALKKIILASLTEVSDLKQKFCNQFQ